MQNRAGTLAAPPSVDTGKPAVRPARWLLAAIFVLSGAFQSVTLIFDNDHFDRVSRGWQILNVGAVPFRDFFDPGYFLTLYSSAFVQWLFGYNLFGEVLLASVFMAIGFTVLFRLATEASRSVTVAAVVTLVAVATQPRLYDYDKVCFYAVGVWLCWRYADRQSAASIIGLALGTVVASLYRIDNGLYVAVGAAVTIVLCHWPDMRSIYRRAALYAGAGCSAALPVLLFLSWHGGIGEATGQLLTYTTREGGNTSLFRSPVEFSVPRGGFPIWLEPADHADHSQPLVKIRWTSDVTPEARQRAEQEFHLNEALLDGGSTWFYRLGDASVETVRRIVIDPRVEDTAGIDRGHFSVAQVPAPPDWPTHRWYSSARLHVTLGWLNRENAVAWLYYTLVFLPLICMAMPAWRTIVARTLPTDRIEIAKIGGAAALTLGVEALILRYPVHARYGAVSVPAAVLVAWLIGQRRSAGTRLAVRTPRGSRVERAAERTLRVVVTGLGGVAVVLTCVSVGILFQAGGPLNLRAGPASALSAVPSLLRSLRATPPSLDLMPGASIPVARYLRACTKPTDRVLLGWFAPEIPYFAGRGFAGGMLVYFGDHWTEPRRQRSVVRRLLAESVPIAILESPRSFGKEYPLIYAHVQGRYDPVGPVEFGEGGVENILSVFVLRGLPATGRYLQGQTALPCFGRR